MRLVFDLVPDEKHPAKLKAIHPALEVDSRIEDFPAGARRDGDSRAFSVILTDSGLYVWFGDVPADVKRLV